jgi:dTDP-4-dehydrorhamnose reductase
MKILITGANGFLGYYLVQQLISKRHYVIATGKGECRLPFIAESFAYVPMDFTDPFTVHDVFEKYQPDAVIHAGAMSKPDDCEKEQWLAYVVNVEGTLNLLINAGECKCFFVFVSTDFIFDGVRGMYAEDDLPNPVNFYGKTKLEAEEAVKEYTHAWTIVRTVMVYGKAMTGRGNILTVVKEKLEKGESYSVFDDQLRTPTYVEDLASGIITIIEKNAKGVYHLSGEDILTPYNMAIAVAERFAFDTGLIRKVKAGELIQPAIRPLKTGFNIQKAKTELGFHPLSFELGLEKTFKEDK